LITKDFFANTVNFG